jgi:hypothetical protein
VAKVGCSNGPFTRDIPSLALYELSDNLRLTTSGEGGASMDEKVAVLEVVTGVAVAFLITWVLEWRERRRSQPTFRENRRMHRHHSGLS